MKQINILKQIAGVAILGLFCSCNDYLDQTPMSTISPENYLNEESQLEAYANGLYKDVLPSHGNWSYGTFGDDQHTDNQAYVNYNNRFLPGQWKTLQSQKTDDDPYKFKFIYSCNYFLENVLGKTIVGNAANINQYIGEIYFLRAYEYFKRYQTYGDFPIVRNTLPDQMEPLIAASQRAPRNEVARFIISDLDSAIMLMGNSSGKRTRISKEVALLVKSRVALFEGTWLKYFKNTAFVPNGPEWPGKAKSYNANYQYPSGDIDKEIEYFLNLAVDAAKQVADGITLVENTGKVQQDASEPANPYMDMFSAEDMSTYPEVMLWRQYNQGLGIVHCVVVGAQRGDYGVGVTRGMVEGFLMANGLPIYAPGSGYHGDETIADVRKDRDSRLTIFLKEPGQKNILYEAVEGTHAEPIETVPNVLAGDAAKAYSTGYALRKGGSFDQKQCGNGTNYTGSITFRGVEAMLNYMEAYYELHGTLDAVAQGYWRVIRERALVDPDFNKTIAATDVSKEALNDWGAYSAGQLVNPTLYNIRRERRCELMAEGLRYMDLRRWRSMDQMISTPYHIEGMKIWGSMQNWYIDPTTNQSLIVYGLDNPKSNMSSPDVSKYIRPYEKLANSLAKDGYKWAMAHYLTPINIQHFDITGGGTESPLYQNPYWPTVPNMPAEK
ncbi:RagB/SusD family nutrient uptake outer membrane protein [uncultured Parabacteroides sp.]|uniref:RagB/SusD family nutrient uptake outer membrane protein n=1 Tax=uncultured Parabacteroides sp. TaxID=512312 RepID=UPI002635E584|nr:RagB/SusD family nutrient uptake outer membrane protein [uncultured Parabacteroides sp.]